MAVYGMLGSAVPTGFLEGAFLPAIIVLVLMCIFINLGKNRKWFYSPFSLQKRDCKITQSDWPKLLALEIPEHSVYSSWTLLLTQWTDTSTCRNPSSYECQGQGQLAHLLSGQDSPWFQPLMVLFFLGQALLETAAMGHSFQGWWEVLFHE